MGRGYSANRSSTQRPANKEKRPRSQSLTRLKNTLGVISKTATTKEDFAKAVAHIDSDDDHEVSEDEDETIVRPDVLTKYKQAGLVVNEVVAAVVSACRVGATTLDLCKMGDDLVTEKTNKMYQKAKNEDKTKMKKGLSFPTTVSINNVLCHHTPTSERDSVVIKNGDVVKVSVSAHVDGYAATSAKTILVGMESHEIPNVPREIGNAWAAMHYAIHGMIRLVTPGAENQDVTDYIAHVSKTFGVEIVEAVLSNRTKRWILDGRDCILARRVLDRDPQQNVGDCIVGENEVWTLDIAFTTADSYRMKQIDNEVNIFRRNQVQTQPRLAAAQDTLAEISEKFLCFPFSPSRLENPLRARLGLTEIKRLDLVDTFPVLGSAKGITVRHCCTVGVTGKRVIVIAGKPDDKLPPMVEASVDIAPTSDILQLMSEELVAPNHRLAKKKTRPATEAANDADAADDADDDGKELPERTRKTHRAGR